ncbi:hypothetical protein POVCU1_081920 [Plasmodium ovale curtisi]|uniref:Uncharacterized protein n=1 Tax=Plasmodium ovale curtisi TaxID=864141 RepID=A0A1A8XCG4_PLAOA|nr:hypothetical protein POVCU1_081920 [Plasmodium ovale curtisi]
MGKMQGPNSGKEKIAVSAWPVLFKGTLPLPEQGKGRTKCRLLKTYYGHIDRGLTLFMHKMHRNSATVQQRNSATARNKRQIVFIHNQLNTKRRRRAQTRMQCSAPVNAEIV